MIGVAYQTVGMTEPVVPLIDFMENVQNRKLVLIIPENELAPNDPSIPSRERTRREEDEEA
jgi:hypothetical protein